jgi:hypothetical protein
MRYRLDDLRPQFRPHRQFIPQGLISFYPYISALVGGVLAIGAVPMVGRHRNY